MFSKACEYAIRSVIYIAQQSVSGRKSGLKETAESVASPEAFTAKILQQLRKSDLINSEKGPNGGFYISTDSLRSLKLKDIVLAIDGDHLYTGCGLGLQACNEEQPCPMHDQFKKIRTELTTMLDVKILTLAKDLTEIPTFLKNQKI